MVTRTLCVFSCICGLLLGATQPAEAVWRFNRVDHSLDACFRFEGGEFVYRKKDDVFHYRISTNKKTAVTANGSLTVESPLMVQEGRVWYVSHLPGPSPQYRLMMFQVETGHRELLYTSSQEISPHEASWCTDRLVLLMGGDWWVWDGTDMQRITFCGASVRKEAPVLRGHHLVWLGDGKVFHTYLPTLETRSVNSASVENLSLRASDTHAAWVEPGSPWEGGYRIRLMPLASLQPATVDTSAGATWFQLRFEPPYLIYVKSSGNVWSIVRVYPYVPYPETLITYSGLPLDNPALHGTDLFFTVMNCVDVECMELFRHNLASRETLRLTSYGRGTFVGPYRADGERLAFVRLYLFNPDQPRELFAGREEPGAPCGTTLPYHPGHVPLNLLLLLLPLPVVWFMRPGAR